MQLLSEVGCRTSVPKKGRNLLSGLKSIQGILPEVGEVEGLGLALRMEMCEADGITPNRRLADRMFQLGLSGKLQLGGTTVGLVLDIGGYYKNVITLAPSLEISTAEMDEAIAALDSLVAPAQP